MAKSQKITWLCLPNGWAQDGKSLHVSLYLSTRLSASGTKKTLDEFPDFETLSVPQEFESDRRRSSTQGGRRPRRYEEETAPAPAPAVEAETAKPEAEEADAAPENTEDSPAAETSDSVEEPAAEDADTANSSAAE